MTRTERAPDSRIRVVCLLDTVAEIGGAETLALEMVIRLDPARFERTLVVTRWTDDAASREPTQSMLARLGSEGVEVVGLPRRSRFDLRPWVSFVRLLRSRKIDILHAHKFGSNLWGTVFGRLTHVPVVVAHEHMWSYEGGGPRSIIDRDLIARFADAFIAVSAEGRRRMVETQGIPARRVTLIPNGIPPLPSGDGSLIRRELGIGTSDPIIGTLAHLRPEKALEVLVAAHARVVEDCPAARLVIAGEGPERAKIERLVAKLGTRERVHLLGLRIDVANLLAAFEVAVCCSDYEGGPLSVMEYMAASLPIVATNVGGLPELVEDRVAGLLVEPRDERALASAVSRLIAEPDLGARLGSAARQRYECDLGIETWVGRIERLYDGLLAAKRRHTAT